MTRSQLASVLALAAVACGPKPTKKVAATPDNTVEEDTGTSESALPPGLTDGALWSCRISDFDAQPCKFAWDENMWTLRKLLGSQRFRGTVFFTSGSPDFDFDGEFFCPWADCTAPMVTTFRGEGGRYATDFGGDRIEVVWDEALANEWGGAGYGGLTGDEQ